MPQLEDSEDKVVVGTGSARQGVTGHHVRYVLAFGLAGVIAVFIALSLMS